jgi:hypothetical protein
MHHHSSANTAAIDTWGRRALAHLQLCSLEKLAAHFVLMIAMTNICASHAIVDIPHADRALSLGGNVPFNHHQTWKSADGREKHVRDLDCTNVTLVADFQHNLRSSCVGKEGAACD